MGGTTEKRVWIGLGLAVLLAVSAVVAWRIPIPATVPAVAWNSSWVFRAEVFVGFFVVAYLLVTIVVTTVRTGQPPGKLSFGLVSYEEAGVKTIDALSESSTALRAVHREVDGLRRQVNDVHVAALGRAAAPAPETDPEFDEAMTRLERTLAELDAMLARPRRTSRAE